MNKPKVLILYPKIPHYRVETLKEISKLCDLTLGYFEGKGSDAETFRQVKLNVRKLGPFIFVRGLRHFCNQYEVVVTQSDFHIPSFALLPFYHRNYKVISWSIGFRVSYTHPYVVDRKHVLLDYLYLACLNACDAVVFYMENAKEFWHNTNLNLKKVFIAPNTTAVEYSEDIDYQNRKDFLFVGTLYKGKGLDILLNSYLELQKQRLDMESKLHIVGEGAERQNVESFIKENGLGDKVILHGGIYEEKKLGELFAKSILCISPNQAGLSAPKSMGYGVTFVTRQDAITGGEVYHITPGVNGVVYQKDEDLLTTMLDAVDNPDKYLNMGKNARDYYLNNATPKHMAQGVVDAINYVM